MKNLSLNRHTLYYGDNEITIHKDSPFKNTLVTIQHNGNKYSLDYTTISENEIKVNINSKEAGTYRLLIKDNLKEYIFPIEYKEFFLNKIKYYNITTEYNKGKIILHLTGNNQDIILNIKGDLEKTIVWKKTQTQLDVKFVHQIFGFKKLKIEINGVEYKLFVIDKEKFPVNILKTPSGIKLDRPSNYELNIKTNNNTFNIEPNTTFVTMDTSNISNIQVSFQNNTIIDQIIPNTSQIPTVYINKNRELVLSNPSKTNVIIKLKGMNEIIIPIGETTYKLNNKGKINYYYIEYVKNADIHKRFWLFII